MAEEIVGWVLQEAGSWLFDKIMDNTFDEAAAQTDVLIHEQAQIESELAAIRDELTKIEKELETWTAVQHIKAWTSEMAANLKCAANGNPQQLQLLLDGLANPNNGVYYKMTSLFDGITGQGITKDNGLLGVWHQEAYTQLADPNNIGYTIRNYVDEIDLKLKACFEILRNGLVLLTTTTQNATSVKVMVTEWAAKMKTLEDAAWDNYPPTMKLFKPSYTADYISTADRYWRFYRTDDNSETLFVYGYSGPIESRGSWNWPQIVDNSAFKITGSVADGLIGLQCRIVTHGQHGDVCIATNFDYYLTTAPMPPYMWRVVFKIIPQPFDPSNPNMHALSFGYPIEEKEGGGIIWPKSGNELSERTWIIGDA